ncbi:hypothetical protein ACFXHA_36740 [Nocardia sp. NPDC059240]|uniref:hypothetical protein n=1 Tax=Nocardia sp. NPDC059240 TaxID=3346786 RepID=UPI0036748638
MPKPTDRAQPRKRHSAGKPERRPTPDDHLRAVLESRHRAPRERRRIPKSAVIMLAAMAVSIALVIVANSRHGAPAGTQTLSGEGQAAVTSAIATAPPIDSYPHATAGCFTTITGDAVTGAGPGDPATGPGAILGFEWAYYSDRSGARAREWVTADAQVPTAETIQAGIDSMPVDTKYCVHITRSASDTWNVTLSEQYPTDPTPQQWAQTITTTATGGRVLITEIRKAQ